MKNKNLIIFLKNKNLELSILIFSAVRKVLEDNDDTMINNDKLYVFQNTDEHNDYKMINNDKLYVFQNFLSSPNKIAFFLRHNFLTALNVLLLYILQL